MPSPDPEAKQQCPLCSGLKKLKDMRDHVGRHILLHSRGVEEAQLQVRTVNHCCLQLGRSPNANSLARSLTTLAGSVAAISAVLASLSPVTNNRSNQTADFTTRSSMDRLRSQQKTRHAPTSQSNVLTAPRRSGSTMLWITSHSGMIPFSTALASIPTLFSRSNSVKKKRRGWVSSVSW